MDTSSVKLFLPGITDVTTLEAASKMCGQAAYRERGHQHYSRHEVLTPAMIRALPAGFALVIRGGYAPVVARLPAAWTDRVYKRARRRGQAVAPLAPAPLPAPAAEPEPAVMPEPVMADELPPDPFPPDTSFPWT
jgi:hypothetical protein